MTDWATSRSLITGAGSGMGRLLTLRILSAGGDVVAWDLDADALEELRVESESYQGSLQTDIVNVADRLAVEAGAARAGAVDILVNNAGIVVNERFSQADPDGLEAVMRVNTLALFWTTKAFLPAMIQRNSGHLVTVASAAGLVPLRGAVSYTASKHAAVGFHDALRQELRDEGPGIQMTLVTPFFINTGMFHGVRSRFHFLLPIVETDAAVERIMRSVSRNRHRVIMPATATAAYLLRLVPTKLGDFVLDQLGISDSMDTFEGRVPKDAEGDFPPSFSTSEGMPEPRLGL